MFTIRRADLEDVESLVPLKAALHRLHCTERPDVFEALDEQQVSAGLKVRLAEPSTAAWLAEEGGQVLGYVLVYRRSSVESPQVVARSWCEIDEVAVDDRHRRSGVARALVENAIAEVRESGVETIQLSAWAFNSPAQAAFTRMGFKPMVVRFEWTEPDSAE